MSMRFGVGVDGTLRASHSGKQVKIPQVSGAWRLGVDQVRFGEDSKKPSDAKSLSLESWLPPREAFVSQFERTIGASPLQKAGRWAKNFLLFPVSLGYGLLMLPMIMYNLARGGSSENPFKLIFANATAIREEVRDERKHNKQYDLLHSKAPLLLRQGKVDEALACFTKALKAYPRLVPDTYTTLGEVCRELLMVTRKGSLEYSQFGLVGLDAGVLEKLKNSGVPYEALGEEAYDRVRYMEAHGVWDPEGRSRTLLLLGNLHEAAGNGPKALHTFRLYLEAVQNTPILPPKEDEEVPEVTHGFSHPIQKSREIEFAKGRLADALSVFGQHEKALAMAKELIAADEHPNGEWLLSLYLRQAEGNPAIADKKAEALNQTLADLEALLEKAPDFRQKSRLAHFCLEQKRYDKALALFQSLLTDLDNKNYTDGPGDIPISEWDRERIEGSIAQIEKAKA